VSKCLILEISADGTSLLQAGVVENGAWQPVTETQLSPVNASIDKTIVVCHGSVFASWSLDVPALSTSKLQKILPNLMADQCATPVADMHLSLIGPVQEGKAHVIAIAKIVIEEALALCRRLGVQPDFMLPDFCLLSTPGSVIGVDGFVRVRLPDNSGFCAEVDLAKAIQTDLKLTDTQTKTASEWQRFLASAADGDVTILQGEFTSRANILSFLPGLKRAAVLSAACLAVWVGSTLITAQSYDDRASKLHVMAEKSFRSAFPEVKRIVNIDAQTRSAVRQLQQQGSGQFLQLSSALFSVVKEFEGVTVEMIRFDQVRGDFAATVSFASFAESEAFRNQLQAKGTGFQEGSSRQEGARIFTDITLKLGDRS